MPTRPPIETVPLARRLREHAHCAKGILVALAACAALFAFCGCSTTQAVRVKPWDRGLLADPLMDPNRDPLATATLEHVYFSREAAQGGAGVGGSGCGCN
jgi:Domain of unknown function (DUF4266)